MSRSELEAIRELSELRHRLRKVLEKVLLVEAGAPLTPRGGIEPAVDMWEDDRRLVVEIEVPGADPASLDLNLQGRCLTISGAIAGDYAPSSTYLRIERPRGRFSRRVALPIEVTGTPEAVLSAGVLTVTLAKLETRRRIAVEPEEAAP